MYLTKLVKKSENNTNTNNGIQNELAYLHITKTLQRNDGLYRKFEHNLGFNFINKFGILQLYPETYLKKSDYKTKSNIITFKCDRFLNKDSTTSYVYTLYGECVIDLTNSRIIFFKLNFNKNYKPFTKKNYKLYWGINGQYYKIKDGITTKRYTTHELQNKKMIHQTYICSIKIDLCNRFYNNNTKKFNSLYSITQILEDETNWKEIYFKDHEDYNSILQNPTNDMDNFFYTNYKHNEHNKK